MSTAASQYLREVKKRIPCSSSQKTEFLCQLEAEVIYYCEDYENTDFAALVNHFGEPADVVNDFLSTLDAKVVNNAFSIKKNILCFLGLFLIFAAVIASASIYMLYKQQHPDIYFNEAITYERELSPAVTGPTYNSVEFSNDNFSEDLSEK